jgi:hypothetical protein
MAKDHLDKMAAQNGLTILFPDQNVPMMHLNT